MFNSTKIFSTASVWGCCGNSRSEYLSEKDLNWWKFGTGIDLGSLELLNINWKSILNWILNRGSTLLGLLINYLMAFKNILYKTAFDFRFSFMSPLHSATVTEQKCRKRYIHLMPTGEILSALWNMLMSTSSIH